MGLIDWKPLDEASDAELMRYHREFRAMRDKMGWKTWGDVPTAWRHAGEELLEAQLRRLEQLRLF
jgi:hypothetical protein